MEEIKTQIIEQIIREAGDIALSSFCKVKAQFKDEKKDAHSVVTEADYAVENFLLKKLQPLFPNHLFVSEETGSIGKDSDYVWYIDPIDGTSNFVRQNPIWSISVGLAYRGVPIFGVMYFPKLEEYFYAQESCGAFLNEKKITVSSRAMDEALYFGGYLYLRGERRYPKLIAQRVAMFKSMICATYCLQQVAVGQAEIYVTKSYKLVDVCAGIIIAKEAGAKVVDSKGKDWNLKSSGLVVTNPTVFEETLNLLNEEDFFDG